MKLKTTITARNSHTETKLIITTKLTGAAFTRLQQHNFHDRAVNAAHDQLRRDEAYNARDIRVV